MVVGRGNGDALPDLAVVVPAASSTGPTVRWLLGTPSQPPVMQPAFTFATNFFPASMAAFDRDGDGDDDLAVAGNNPSVMLLATQAGASTANGAVPLLINLHAELCGVDLDGDQDDDLLAFSPQDYTHMLVAGFVNQGGLLTATTQTLTTTSMGSFHAGDVDGDGDQDLVARTDEGLSMFENLGGTFVPRSDCVLGVPRRTGEPGLLDVDGDGHLDFVDTLSVWFGDGTFASPVTAIELSAHDPLDWEGDGDLDLRVFGGLLRNDGRGQLPLDALAFPPAPGPNLEYRQEVVVADFDGDGRRELLAAVYFRDPAWILNVTFQGMHRLEDTGTGQFVDLGAVTNASLPMQRPAFAVDTNGDSILDVVDRNGVWVHGGNHQFTLQPQPFGLYEPMAAGDVDGDGDIDFLGGMHGTTLGIAILLQTAPNTFTPQVVSASTNHAVPLHRGVLVDLDGDGDLDIAVDRSWASGAFEVWTNQAGVFSLAWSASRNGPPTRSQAMAGDVDGDGRTDVAFAIGDTLVVFRRNGPGLTYDAPAEFHVQYATTFADVDDDGDPDVLGTEMVRNRRLVMPFAGQRRQYGTSATGTGGMRPVLGCSGQLRVGSTPVLRLRDAVGGTFTLLGMGFQTANYASPVLPGLVGYTFPLVLTLGFGVGGAPGAAGAGTLDVPVAIPPGFHGVQLWFQHFVFDSGAANGIAHTNGLEFTIGG